MNARTFFISLSVALAACGGPEGKSPGGGSSNNGTDPSNNGGGGALVIDCNSPTYVTVLPVPIAIVASDEHVFVASSGAVENPEVVQVVALQADPAVVGTIDLEARVSDMAVEGSTLYVLTGMELRIYDVSDPTQPAETASTSFDLQPLSLALNGTTAVVNFGGYVEAVDVSDVASPVVGERLEIGALGIRIAINDVAAFDGTIWVAGIEGTLVAVEPMTWSVLSTTEVSPPPADTYAARGIVRFGDVVLLRAGKDLVAFRMNDPSSVGQTASMEVGSARGRVSQLVGHADEFLLIDTDLFDASNAESPEWVGRFSTSGFTSWSVGANDDYIFVGYQKNQGDAQGLLQITTPACRQQG